MSTLRANTPNFGSLTELTSPCQEPQKAGEQMRKTDRLMNMPLAAAMLAICFVTSAALSAPLWVQKGPAPAIKGQPENIPNSPIAGAIEAVVAHPTNADIIWVGAVNGGIFKTTNATAGTPTWTPQTDAQSSMSIGALVLDPTDGTNNTLVAGIGRTSSYGFSGGSRAGLLRTTDGGTNWFNLTSLAGSNVVGLAARGSTIVAAVNAGDANSCGSLGIYRSTDAGASFTQISDDGTSGMPCGFSYDLASDPTDNSRLFAPATGLGTTSDGIYRSTDTGATWTKVSNPAMDAFLSNSPNRVEIVVGNAGGGNANVFAAICNGGSLAGLFRSGDAGQNWASLDLPSTTEQGTSYGIHPGNQCAVHMSLVADPGDPNVVYIGGDRQPANNENGSLVSQFPNSIGASTYGGRLFRVDASQTPGSQATPITNCPTALPGCGGSARTASDSAPHADSRELAFDANGDLIQTDDGGIYKHTDPSGTTGDWVSLVGDLAVVEQHNMDYDSVSNIMISGNQDNGTTQQQTSASDEWEGIFGGDGGDVVVAEGDPVAGASTRYFSAQLFLGATRATYNGSNVLQSFAYPSLTPLVGDPAPTAQFVTPLEVNRVTPTRLLFGAGNGVYESTDRLDSVTRIATGTANFFGGGGAMAYGATGNAEAIYVGSGDLVYRRTTGSAGTGLTPSDPDAGSAQGIRGVVIDPDDGSTAFAVDTSTVFRTTNGGSDWTKVTGNLLSLSPGALHSVSYVNNGGDRLVVGTERGVYVATEASGFSTWALLGTGLPNVPVFEIEYDSADDLLAAGTLGRGAWLLDLSGGCAPDDSFEPDNSSVEASTIADGVTQAHKMCPATDEDWATFTLAAESEVTLETSGASGDTTMALYDNTGTLVEYRDDINFPDNLFSFIDRTCAADPLPAGTYFVGIGSYNNADNPIEITDAYDLDYTLVQACGGGCAPDDSFEPDNSSVEASTIADGVTQAHKMCPATDEDWATFTLAAESEVTLETSGASGDTTMRLYDNTGTLVEYRDDINFPDNLFSFIDRTCAADPLPAGTYFVGIGSYNNDDNPIEITDAYDLDYTLVQACGGGVCPDNVTLANTTINTPQTVKANLTISVGPSTTINAAGVTLQAGTSISFGAGVSIGGAFRAVIGQPTCT